MTKDDYEVGGTLYKEIFRNFLCYGSFTVVRAETVSTEYISVPNLFLVFHF